MARLLRLKPIHRAQSSRAGQFCKAPQRRQRTYGLPDVFDGIQFGTARRQREKADVFGDIELA